MLAIEGKADVDARISTFRRYRLSINTNMRCDETQAHELTKKTTSKITLCGLNRLKKIRKIRD